MEENKGTNNMAADLDHALRKKTFLREGSKIGADTN
jgi:hypothetical protein